MRVRNNDFATLRIKRIPYLFAGYQKAFRCKSCGKIYPEYVPDVCRRCGKELTEEIKEHVAGHCAWLKNDKEIEEYSASCLASGAYMHWEDFKDKRIPVHKVFLFEGGDL